MAVNIWNPAGASTDMNLATNWSLSALSITDNLQFDATKANNAIQTANLSAASITITSAYAGSITMSSYATTLTSDFDASAFTHTITTNDTTTISIGGNFSIGTGVTWTTGNNATITFTGTPTITVVTKSITGRVIFQNGATFVGAVTNNYGRMTFAAGNTYTWAAGSTTNIDYRQIDSDMSGTLGNIISFVSSTPNTQYSIKITAGGIYTQNVSYLSLTDLDHTSSARVMTANGTCVRGSHVGGVVWPTAYTHYVDYVTGNDNNPGTEASPVKTTNALTAAHGLAAGDTIYIFKSPDPVAVSGVNATWTSGSSTVTLSDGTITKLICNCESVWTSSQGANVVPTVDTAIFKEGTKSCKLAIAAGATAPGNLAYFATGALDLSAYSQLSLWFYTNVNCASGTFSIRLYNASDGTGSYNNFVIPALMAGWNPITIDLGTTMRNDIASIALYFDTDIGAINVYIDDVIACYASSAANYLSLTSLIGKAQKSTWVANHVYSVNDICIPTHLKESNRYYKCTTGGTSHATTEPTWPNGAKNDTITDGSVVWTDQGIDIDGHWQAIQSINGTTVKIDNSMGTLPTSVYCKYPGITSVAPEQLYRRDVIQCSFSTTYTYINKIYIAGTSIAPITIKGGYNSVNHIVDGYTFYHGCANAMSIFDANAVPYLNISFIGFARFYSFNLDSSSSVGMGISCVFSKIHAIASTYGIFIYQSNTIVKHCSLHYISTREIICTAFNDTSPYCGGMQIISCILTNASSYYGLFDQNSYPISTILKNKVSYCEFYYNNYAINCNSGSFRFYKCITANNVAAAFYSAYCAPFMLDSCTTSETGTVLWNGINLNYESRFIALNHNAVNNHIITGSGFTITAQTSIRYEASGLAWAFAVTSTVRTAGFPVRFELGKIECVANKTTTIGVRVRRSNTDITANITIPANQISGVTTDIVATASAIADTWEELQVAITPTATGYVSIEGRAWGGTTYTAYFHTVRVVSVV